MAERVRKVSRAVSAGCVVCGGAEEPMWIASNSQGIAAQHHDKTGHQTWVRVQMEIFYGEACDLPGQMLLFTRTGRKKR